MWNKLWIQDRVEEIEIVITLKEMYPVLNWKNITSLIWSWRRWHDMISGTRNQDNQHFMESIFQQTRKFPSEDKVKKALLLSSFSSWSEVPFPSKPRPKEELNILFSLGISGYRRKHVRHFAMEGAKRIKEICITWLFPTVNEERNSVRDGWCQTFFNTWYVSKVLAGVLRKTEHSSEHVQYPLGKHCFLRLCEARKYSFFS